MLIASPGYVFVCSSHLFVAICTFPLQPVSHLRSQVCSRGSVMLKVSDEPKEQPCCGNLPRLGLFSIFGLLPDVEM